jgi:trk system potassium uptake protein TrkA
VYFIVIGCGRVGSQLAQRLARRGQEVTIVDETRAAFMNLPSSYRGRTIEGSALSEAVLRSAEIDRADGLAAATQSDTLNAVVGHAARTFFGLGNVVVRNYDPRLLPLHHVFRYRVVSSTVWGAERIDALLHDPARRSLPTLGSEALDVYEIRIPAFWNGRILGELVAGLEVAPVVLSRGDEVRVAKLSATLADGDVLHVAAEAKSLAPLLERLAVEEAP